jgi:hypothetical protein
MANTYDLMVLNANPVGYWTFSNTLNDLSSASNTASSSGLIQYTPTPILANGGNSLRVTSTSSITIGNTSGNYEIFSKNYVDKQFTIEFWFNFNNELMGSGLGTTPYNSNKLNLLNIQNSSGTTVVANIYYDYLTNSVRFSFVNSNRDAYLKLPPNFVDKTLHIVATYDNGSLQIFVNGVQGVAGVSDSTNLNTISKTNLVFTINGNSLTTINPTFIISNLSFYNTILDYKNQIVPHYIAGNSDASTFILSTHINSLSYLDFTDGFYNVTKGSYDANNSNGTITKITKDDFKLNSYGIDFSKDYYGTSGMSVQRINKADYLKFPYYYYMYDTTGSTLPVYSYSTSSGISWSGSVGGIDLSNIIQGLDFSKGLIFSGQISARPSDAENNYIFSINNLANNQTIYLTHTRVTGTNPSVYTLYLQGASITTLVSASTSTTFSSSANFIVNFIDSNNIYLYVNENSASYTNSVSLATSLPKISTDTKVYVGNIINPWVVSKAFNGYIKNFGIYDGKVSSYNSFNFSKINKYLVRFTSSVNPLFISQYGSATAIIKSSNNLLCDMQGTKLDWFDDNATVSVSKDGGSTYQVIYRHQPVTSYDITGFGSYSKNLIVKVELSEDNPNQSSPDSAPNVFRSIDWISYTSLTRVSDGGNQYKIDPISKLLSNYTLKDTQNNNPIYGRPRNFGIDFYGDTYKNPTAASVTVPSGASYSAIEFWYRPNNLSGSLSNFLINNVSSSTTAPAIWINSSSKFQSVGGTLYINGNSVADNSYTASVGEMYYLSLVLNTPSNSNFYINGGNLGSAGISSCATYGNFYLWDSIRTPTSGEISYRYGAYIGVPSTVIINDSDVVRAIPTSATSSVSSNVEIKTTRTKHPHTSRGIAQSTSTNPRQQNINSK